MPISFNQVSADLLVPFVAVEYDSSAAISGPSLLPYRLLILAQRHTAQGTAVANTLYQLTGKKADRAGVLCGRRSMAYSMVRAAERAAPEVDTWLMVLADGAGVAAAGTVTIVGTATANGTLHLFIEDRYIPVAIAASDTPTAQVVKCVTAINATDGVPFTASGTAGVLTCTYNNLGEVGNGALIGVNLLDGQALPTGVSSATIVQPTGGTVNPTLTTAIANLGSEWFQVVAHPYTDATSLTAIETELADRAGPMRMIDGFAVTGTRGSISTIGTLVAGRNSSFSSIVAPPLAAPQLPPCNIAAATAAAVAASASIDPARPFQTLPIGSNPGPVTAQSTPTERNVLLLQGGATTTVDRDGTVRIDRMVTTYKTNAAGAPDPSYRDANTVLTLSYLRYDWRNRIRTKYPRHKLANDGGRIAGGQPIMTPALMKGECISWFKDMIDIGLVEAGSLDQFKRDLRVERNVANRTRIDVLLPPDLMNQLITTAAQIQFRL